MEVGPIFIFASGQRCGSTLLQRFLCTHPDVLIWGEHDGVLRQIFPGFDRMYEWERLFGHQLQAFLNDGVDNFIPNIIPTRDVIHHTHRQVVTSMWRDTAMDLGRPIWGFKEVLYDADMAVYLRAMFPNAKVIHITRHVFKTFTSMLHEERLKPYETYVPLKEIWTRQRTIEALNNWVHINESFMDNPELDASWVFSTTYERMTGDRDREMTKLIHWLGLNPHDFDFNLFDRRIYTDRTNGTDAKLKDSRQRLGWEDLSAEEYTLLTAEPVLRVARRLNYDMPEPRREPAI